MCQRIEDCQEIFVGNCEGCPFVKQKYTALEVQRINVWDLLCEWDINGYAIHEIADEAWHLLPDFLKKADPWLHQYLQFDSVLEGSEIVTYYVNTKAKLSQWVKVAPGW